MSQGKNREIEELQARILQRALDVFFVLAILATAVLAVRTYLFNEWTTLIVVITVAISFFFMRRYRDKIRSSYISTTLVATIFIVLAAGLLKLGLLAAAIYYITLVPIFTYLTTSYRKAIYTLGLCLLMYGAFAFLYVQGYLSADFDLNTYISNPVSWLLNMSIVALTSLAILDIVNYFRNGLLQSYSELEKHRDHLEESIVEKTANLHHLNEELQKSNKDLQANLLELKEAQNQLLAKEKLASLGMLTAGIAHEIKNPLNYISSSHKLLESRLKEDGQIDTEVEQLLSFIETGSKRMNGIIKGLNHFSREKENFDEACNIPEIIESCLNMLSHLTTGRIELSHDYQKELPIIYGNVGKLHQVFTNLITNAAQAIEGTGRIHIEIRASADSICTRISDSGSGISAENLKKIQDPFFTTKAPGIGTGLGLSITRRIIEEHQGKIAFQSEPGKGTTVEVFLPSSIAHTKTPVLNKDA
ncbi:sensor histidine kinase [Croceimicrobium sp.]|uniref:sensor histidine kinase n=1 Tax=Croceimicrobium sp. TaxID=2828340 RepID=UPI003BAA023C